MRILVRMDGGSGVKRGTGGSPAACSNGECVSQSDPQKKAGAVSATEIPDKLYFRIGEVARLLGVAPYVLRFWEGEFPHLKPNKGGTGQRLYRRRDVEAAFRIKQLLYDEGYTIAGARQTLKLDAKAAAPKLLLGIETRSDGVDTVPLRRIQTELRAIADILARPSPGLGRQGQSASEQGKPGPGPDTLGQSGAAHKSLHTAAEAKPAEWIEETNADLLPPGEDKDGRS